MRVSSNELFSTLKMMTNAKVIEAKQTEEQVHFSSSPGRSGSGFTRRSSRNHGNGAGRHGHDQRQHSSFEQRGSRSCGFCGANERHSRRNCPANKPGVVCSNCGGRNHFTTVCRSPKDYFKRRSSTQPTHALDHAASAEEDSGDDFEHFCLDESVHALPSSASKLFTTLSLSVSGDSFVMLSFKWIQLLPATLCRIISSRKSARTQICNPPRPSWFRIQGKQSVHWVKSLWFTKTPSSSCSWTSMWWTYLASQPYLDCQTQVVCRCCTLTRRAWQRSPISNPHLTCETVTRYRRQYLSPRMTCWRTINQFFRV